MWKCEARNVRLCVLIRTVKEIWLLQSRCWLWKKIETISSHVLITTWSSGKLTPQQPVTVKTTETQTSHRLCCNRHWRTDCSIALSPSRSSDVVTPSLCSNPTTSASLHQTDSDRSWCRQWVIDSSSLTFTSPHNSNISTVTNRLSLFLRPPTSPLIDVCFLSSVVGDVTGGCRGESHYVLFGRRLFISRKRYVDAVCMTQ